MIWSYVIEKVWEILLWVNGYFSIHESTSPTPLRELYNTIVQMLLNKYTYTISILNFGMIPICSPPEKHRSINDDGENKPQIPTRQRHVT